ncbi:MAG TPA: LacI family DNA-binding transcriptional regulator [Beutenbergiaceae bacterium]|nr:LacI family DNA-binding transcriptional regulator [Beutenbergiaceae bacterium]
MSGPVTLSDVARVAGVSLATASRAINGSATRTVRSELREKVLAAAAELQYAPNANAQAMARGQTTALGLIVHDIADPYFSSIAAGVTDAAESAGLMVTLGSTQHDPEREVALLQVLHRQRARAIVVAGGRHDDEEVNTALSRALASYRMAGGTVAMISQPVFDVDTVAIDNAESAGQLAQALVGRGYRQFAVLGGPKDHLTARERRDGFAAALAGQGLQVDDQDTIECAFTRDGGYSGMQRLLAGRTSAQVVFAVNDVMALGAMAAARDAGVEVGRGIGIAGFDDIATLRDVTPGLTTVQVPLVAIGALATNLALVHHEAPAQHGGLADAEHLTTRRDGTRLVRVPGSLVMRDSTPGPATSPARIS